MLKTGCWNIASRLLTIFQCFGGGRGVMRRRLLLRHPQNSLFQTVRIRGSSLCVFGCGGWSGRGGEEERGGSVMRGANPHMTECFFCSVSLVVVIPYTRHASFLPVPPVHLHPHANTQQHPHTNTESHPHTNTQSHTTNTQTHSHTQPTHTTNTQPTHHTPTYTIAITQPLPTLTRSARSCRSLRSLVSLAPLAPVSRMGATCGFKGKNVLRGPQLTDNIMGGPPRVRDNVDRHDGANTADSVFHL